MAHTMKGNAGNIGASTLSELAAEIESKFSFGDQLPDGLIDKYESHFSAVIEEVERLAEHYLAKRDCG